MLEQPALQDEDITICLRTAYALAVVHLTFLPLGADVDTAVYRASTHDGRVYFVKLRRGVFHHTSVAFPKWLSDQGIAHIIAPLATTTGQLWTSLDTFTVILYPFVEGHNGYEVALSDRLWHDFGRALNRMHTAVVPLALTRHLPRETYSPHWREHVTRFVEYGRDDAVDDPAARQLAAFLQARRAEILDLVGRAERHAQALQARSPDYIVCHADLHPGNLLLGANDALYIVDWDTLILAPKERDLMFIGGGLGFVGHTAQAEELLFYRGYGDTPLDPIGLAYYRYERIIQDIAAFCEQLLLTREGGEDRAQAVRYVMWNFLPGHTIERAYAADPPLHDA